MKSLGAELFTMKDSTGCVAAYRRISAKDAGLKESSFQEAIYANPEVVISACRSGGVVTEAEQWYPWAREYPIADTGYIDVLLLSSSGRIGVVETKLSFNPERRREVVAQILDYAIALQETPFDRLPPISESSALNPPTEHDIQDALTAGRLLLIVAGDRLESRAIRLSESILAAHLTSEWDLAMIDLNVYEGTGEPPRLLVPELRGRLIHETRQVVRITVEGEQPKAKIEVERLPDPSRAGERMVWTLDSFHHALTNAAVSDEFRQLVRRLMLFPQRYPSTNIVLGSGKLGSVTLRRAGGSILSLLLDGRAETKPTSYLERALGGSGARLYQEAVARLWGAEFADGWKRPTASQVSQRGQELLGVLEQAIATAP
jgi:hypothetical protein